MEEKKLDLSLGKASKKISKKKLSDAIWGYVFVSPLTIGLLMFLFVPLVYSLYISMTDYDLFNAPQWNNFYNFTKLFSPAGEEFWKSVGNAFVMCIGTFISIGLSLLVAAILCGKIKFINFFKSVYFGCPFV